jgi:hypothetical protein
VIALFETHEKRNVNQLPKYLPLKYSKTRSNSVFYLDGAVLLRDQFVSYLFVSSLRCLRGYLVVYHLVR